MTLFRKPSNKVASNKAFLELIDDVEPKCLKESLIDYIKSDGLTFIERDILEKIIDKTIIQLEIKQGKISKYQMINKE